MALCDFKRFVDTLPDGNGGDHNDELGEPVTLVQFENSFRIDVSFAGPGLHFHTELHFFNIIGQGQIVALLYGMHVLAQCIWVEEQRVSNSKVILQQA